jgi:hypothetical protein
MEKKCKSISSSSYVLGYGGGSVLNIQLTPNTGYLAISQGTGQGDRIGNRIRPTKAMFRGMLYPKAYDATYNAAMVPYDVRLTVLKNKVNPVGTSPDTSTLFQSGDTVAAPTGGLSDMMSPFNLDANIAFTSRRCKVGTAGYTGTGAFAAGQYYQNNDYKLNQAIEIDLLPYIPTTIDYLDTSTTPSSYSLYLNVLIAAANGAISSELRPLQMDWTIIYEYVDA